MKLQFRRGIPKVYEYDMGVDAEVTFWAIISKNITELERYEIIGN